MKTIIFHWFTETDNKTFDLSKFLAFIAVVAGIGLTIHNVIINHNPFVFQDYGIGVGSLFGSLAALFNLKKDTPNG